MTPDLFGNMPAAPVPELFRARASLHRAQVLYDDAIAEHGEGAVHNTELEANLRQAQEWVRRLEQAEIAKERWPV